MNESIQVLLRKAHKRERLHDFEDARKIYESILSRFPGNVHAKKKLRNLIPKTQSTRQMANLSFARDVEESSNNETIRSSKVDTLRKLVSSGDMKDALDLANKLLDKSPMSSELNCLMGIIQSRYGNIDAALASQKIAMKLDPNALEPKYHFAELLQKLGKFDEAISAYIRVNDIDPKFKEALLNCGNCHLSLRDFKQAQKYYVKALEIDPSYLLALENMGISFQMLNDYASAETYFQQVMKLAPNEPNSYEILAQNFINKDDYATAIELLLKSNQMWPNNARTHHHVADVYLREKKYSDALNYFNSAIKLNPKMESTYLGRGLTFYQKGDYELSLNDFRTAISLNPKSAVAHIRAGNAELELKNMSNAIVFYKEALKLDPSSLEALNNLGYSLLKYGEYQGAIEICTNALKHYPNEVRLYNNLAVAYLETASVDGAQAILEKAISLEQRAPETLFNLCFTSGSVLEVIANLRKCISVNDDFVEAKMLLAAMQYYAGEKNDFDRLSATNLCDHPYMKSFEFIFSQPEQPRQFFNRWALFDYVLTCSDFNRAFYEFGVWRGTSFKYLGKHFKKSYGFDTFEGLPENWHDVSAGTYTSEGNVPEVYGAEFIAGAFEETLPKFFNHEKMKAGVINFDADLYSSTKNALENASQVIDEKTILIFDEFLMNKNWQHDEYRALNEFCADFDCKYEVIAFSFLTKQVAVKLK